MAGTFATKQTAGQLAATIGDLYTCPASTTAIVKTITVVNTDSSARTMNLYILKAAGTARRIVPKNMALAAGYNGIEDSTYTLEAGDKIQGDASAANVVDYTISYVQET